MKFSSLFKDMAIYGLGDVLLKMFSIITLPIYTRIFSPEDFGILTSIVTFSALFSQVIELGINSAFARFYFQVESLYERQKITSTALFFITIWSIVAAGSMIPFAGIFSRWFFQTEKYNPLLILSLFGTSLALINGFTGQILRNQFKAKSFAILNTVSSFLGIGLSLLFILGYKQGILGFFLANLVVNLGMMPIRYWLIKESIILFWSWQILKSLMVYGIPLIPMSIAYWVFVSSDRLIIGKLSTFEQLGLYSVANNISNILGFFNSALGQAFSPYAIKHHEENRETSGLLLGKCLTYIVAVFGLLCLGLSTFSLDLIKILSTVDFYPAALAVGPLSLGFVAFASTQVTALGITLSNKTYYFVLFSWLSALLNLALNILLVPSFGMLGASWATAFSYIFLTICYAIKSRNLIEIQYEIHQLLTITIITAIGTLLIPFLPDFTLLINIIIKLIYCSIYVMLIILFQGIKNEDVNFLWLRARATLERKTK